MGSVALEKALCDVHHAPPTLRKCSAQRNHTSEKETDEPLTARDDAATGTLKLGDGEKPPRLTGLDAARDYGRSLPLCREPRYPRRALAREVMSATSSPSSSGVL